MTFVLLPIDDYPIASEADVQITPADSPDGTASVKALKKVLYYIDGKHQSMLANFYHRKIEGLTIEVFKVAAREATQTGFIDLTNEGIKRHLSALGSSKPEKPQPK